MVQVGVEEEVSCQQGHHQIEPAQQQDDDDDGRKPGEDKYQPVCYSNTDGRSDRERSLRPPVPVNALPG